MKCHNSLSFISIDGTTAVILHRFHLIHVDGSPIGSDEPEVEWRCLNCCYRAQKGMCAIKCHLSAEIIIFGTSGNSNKTKQTNLKTRKKINKREKKGNYGLLSHYQLFTGLPKYPIPICLIQAVSNKCTLCLKPHLWFTRIKKRNAFTCK